MGFKVSGPTRFNWTPLFDWCVVRCGFKNKYQNDMCSKEVGLCVQKFYTNLGLIVNTTRGGEGGGVVI